MIDLYYKYYQRLYIVVSQACLIYQVKLLFFKRTRVAYP